MSAEKTNAEIAEKTEEIFSEFKEHSVAEFFRKNRQMLGFSGKVRSLTTIVHELVTNSIDATEGAGILADILVKVEDLGNEHYKVYAEDNGTGIPKELIGKALGQMLAGTKFHRYMQQRGQQGIGAAAVCLYSQLTTGKPIHARSGLGDGKVFDCDISIDVKTNSPMLNNQKEHNGNFRGLVFEGEFAEVKYEKSAYGPLEYLKRTAIANPHAQITFIDPEGSKIVFPRAVNEIPKRPKEVKPHPLGIGTNELIEMAHHSPARKLSSFLTNDFERVSSAKVDELQRLVPNVNLEKRPGELKWDEAEAVVKAFKNVRWIAPATDSIIPIGKEQIEKALKNILNPEFMSVTERKPKVFRGGVPFQVEAAIAYGGGSGKETQTGRGGDIIRFANRAPLLFDTSGCAITEAAKSIEWRRYDIKDFENEPITVFVNLISVYVPYAGAGKQSIAQEDEIIEEIRYGIMEVARDAQQYLRGKIRDTTRDAKKKAIMRYVKQLSNDLPNLAGKKEKPDEIEKKLIKLIETKYKKAIEEGEISDEEIKQAKGEEKDSEDEE